MLAQLSTDICGAAIKSVPKHCRVTRRVLTEANMGASGATVKYGNQPQHRLASGAVLAGTQVRHLWTKLDAGCLTSEMTSLTARPASASTT